MFGNLHIINKLSLYWAWPPVPASLGLLEFSFAPAAATVWRGQTIKCPIRLMFLLSSYPLKMVMFHSYSEFTHSGIPRLLCSEFAATRAHKVKGISYISSAHCLYTGLKLSRVKHTGQKPWHSSDPKTRCRLAKRRWVLSLQILLKSWSFIWIHHLLQFDRLSWLSMAINQPQFQDLGLKMVKKAQVASNVHGKIDRKLMFMVPQ